MDKFSTLLDKFREERHVSKKVLANRANLTPGYISLLTRGVRKTPSENTVDALAKALELDEGSKLQLLVAAGYAPKSSALPVVDDERPAQDESVNTDKVDWDAAPNTQFFHGRENLLEQIGEWITEEHCQMILIMGIGGVGKTMFATKVAEQVQGNFDYVIWRSLLSKPDCHEFLQDCIAQLVRLGISVDSQENLELDSSDGTNVSIDVQITRFLRLLKENRCLLVLDNINTLLKEKISAGQYDERYSGYAKLFKQIGVVRHKSCVLLTSREKPEDFTGLEGDESHVRSLQLPGLEQVEGEYFLRKQGLTEANTNDLVSLVEFYSGNLFALKLVVGFIKDVFGGDVRKFLQVARYIPKNVYDLLEEQFVRLSKIEQRVIYWFAIEREPLALDDLQHNLVPFMQMPSLYETLSSLKRRSLIETSNTAAYYLHPMVLEYMTERFIGEIYEEITGLAIDSIDSSASTRSDFSSFDENEDVTDKTRKIELLGSHAVSAALARNFIRERQVKFILEPLARRLLDYPGKEQTERRLKKILSLLPTMGKEGSTVTYAAGNIINLLVEMDIDLRNFDFSHQVVRQAYLQGVSLPDTDFSYANLEGSLFTDSFGSIFSVAFVEGQNSLLLAAGTTNGEVRLWDVSRGIQLYNWQGHTCRVRSIVFHQTQDGGILASGSEDTTIRLWDISTGQSLRTLNGESWTYSIAFSPDGTLLASGHDDHCIRLWDVQTGTLIETLRGHTGRIRAVTFSPDGHTLASGGEDRTVRLWNVETFQNEKVKSYDSWIYTLAFNFNGTLLASGHNDKTVRLLNTTTWQAPLIWQGHQGRVRSVAFHPGGSVLASGSDDQEIWLWDVNEGYAFKKIREHTSWVYAVAFNASGNTLASGSDDQTIHLWNINLKQQHESKQGRSRISLDALLLRTIQGYSNRVFSVALHPHESLLASGSEDYAIRLWRLENAGTEEHPYVLRGHENWVYAVAFSPDGNLLVSGSDDKTVRVWNIHDKQPLMTLHGHADRVRTVAISPDGAYIASGSDDNTIRLWDIHTGLCVKILKQHTNRIRSVAFHPYEKVLASGSEDKSIILWNIETGQPQKTLNGHTDRVQSIAFHPNGMQLASGSEDYTIRLWDLQTDHAPKILSGHQNWVHSIAYSCDGAWLVSGSEDRTMRLWDAKTGEYLHTFERRGNWVYSVAFSTNPQTATLLADGSYDGMIELWNVETREYLRTLRSKKPYEGMNIFGVEGLNLNQKTVLTSLGAVEIDPALTSKKT